jgi:hypothetical protein
VQFCSVVSFPKSVVNIGIKLHNKLPDNVKKLGNFKLLKKELKSLLLSHSLYSVDKFLQFWVKVLCNVWDYSLVIFNSFIKLILMYFTALLYCTVYWHYCFNTPYGYLLYDCYSLGLCIYIVISLYIIIQGQC